MKLCNGAEEYPRSSLQHIKIKFSKVHMHLAEKHNQLTVTRVKFNYRPAVDALRVSRGDWGKQQPGGDPAGDGKSKSQ